MTFAVEGDLLTLSYNKTQFLNILGNDEVADQEGIEFFRAELSDGVTVVSWTYERMK